MSGKPLQITPEQQRTFDEDGFFLVEDALSPTEVEELTEVVDELYTRYRKERNLGPHADGRGGLRAIHFGSMVCRVQPSLRSPSQGQ